MSTTISYKGNTIATAVNVTKTLETAGKYLEADVLVTDVTTPAYVNPWLYPYNYGSEDASNYFFTGKKNLQQTEPFTSSDGQATIVFPKALMGDAAPSDVRAGKIFTSANGIQSVGTAIMGPTYFDFELTYNDQGWTPWIITTTVTPSDVRTAYANGELCIARVTESGDTATYFGLLYKIDSDSEVWFDFNTQFYGQLYSNGNNWTCNF